MINADERQEDTHHVQENSPSVLCNAGVESIQMEYPSTEE